MASEYGERVILLGNSMGDHAEAMSAAASSTDELAGDYTEIIAAIDTLYGSAIAISNGIQMLTAKAANGHTSSETMVEVVSGHQSKVEETAATADNTLRGTTNPQALSGLQKCEFATGKVGMAHESAQVAEGDAEELLMDMHFLFTTMQTMRAQMAAIRGRAVKVGHHILDVHQYLNESSADANTAKEELVSYGTTQ
jgi:hypothetical protein